MNQLEWDEIAEDLEYGFKWAASDPWNDVRERVYRRHLDRYPADVVHAAIARLMQDRRPWGPSISEIIGALEHDPGIPSWPEARTLLLGPRGALRRHTVRGTPDTNPAYWREREEQAIAALAALHPVLAAFVAGHGVQTLAETPAEGPDRTWAEIRLREDWQRHTAAWVDRGQHQRAAARLGHRQPRHLAPLASTGLAQLGPAA